MDTLPEELRARLTVANPVLARVAATHAVTPAARELAQERLLSSIDPVWRSRPSLTFLYHLIIIGHYPAIQAYLNIGPFDPHLERTRWNEALTRALVEQDNARLLSELLEQGFITEVSETALRRAAQVGDATIAVLADDFRPRQRTYFGHILAARGRSDLVARYNPDEAFNILHLSYRVDFTDVIDKSSYQALLRSARTEDQILLLHNIAFQYRSGVYIWLYRQHFGSLNLAAARIQYFDHTEPFWEWLLEYAPEIRVLNVKPE